MKNRNPESIVGWALAILALIFAACTMTDVRAETLSWDGYLWASPTHTPCEAQSIKWVQEKGPIKYGQAAYADFETCTVHSIYSESDAKIVPAAGYFSKHKTSLYKHETDHLRTGREHPEGKSAAGWGDEDDAPRAFGPPEIDTSILHDRR